MANQAELIPFVMRVRVGDEYIPHAPLTTASQVLMPDDTTLEYGNIAANRSSGNVKFKRQIVVCIMPSMAQYLQQLLPPFTWTHALTPLRCSWGDAKKLMGRLLSHSSKFVEKILDAWIFCITLPPKI